MRPSSDSHRGGAPSATAASPTGPRETPGFFSRFIHSEAASSVLLMICTVLAMGWANSRWHDGYEVLLHMTLGVTVAGHAYTLSVHEWINDGFMAIFFFVVGLEIKREVVVGQLSSLRQAALPAAAALGGMLMPAAIYAAFNAGGPGAHGWGIPMATDIAFALGVLALLGARVPLSLKVFLTALAIADDLGAVLVIAVFYTETIRLSALGAAAVLLALFVLLIRRRVRQPLVLLIPVVGVWTAILASGVHATVAGILVAMMIPMRAPLRPQRFAEIVRARLPGLEAAGVTRESVLLDEAQLDAVLEVYEAAASVRPPGLTLERLLHPLQAYVVLPLFALFNAGIAVDPGVLASVAQPIGLGIILGLLIGKPLGLLLFGWVAVRSGLASLPAELSWRMLFGVGWLAGIGFTMSFFVGGLAFKSGTAIDQAKVGILVGSLIAAVTGYCVLRVMLPTPGANDSAA
jgi:Na+:H+ antiporter, NhaA family